MKRTLIIGGLLVLVGCANSPKTALDLAGCMAAVQTAVQKDAGLPPAQIAIDAALVAATNAACVGLVVDVNNSVITVQSKPLTAAMPVR